MLSIEYKTLSIKDKMSKAIELYNNSYHSVMKEKPINVEFGNCNKIKIYNNIISNKNKYINKRNRIRELYRDDRKQGYIKNYKALRHKEEPKFKLKNLENIHSSNVKRKTKHDGLIDTRNFDNNL